jgi:hypothetical protein
LSGLEDFWGAEGLDRDLRGSRGPGGRKMGDGAEEGEIGRSAPSTSLRATLRPTAERYRLAARLYWPG